MFIVPVSSSTGFQVWRREIETVAEKTVMGVEITICFKGTTDGLIVTGDGCSSLFSFIFPS